MAYREHLSRDAQVEDVMLVTRTFDDEMLGSSLSLALGMMIGQNLFGSAAAIAVAYERLFPGKTLPYMPPLDPKVANSRTYPGAIVEAAWALVYNMEEGGDTGQGKWWEQEFLSLRRLLQEKGFNCTPGEE